jgi:hypothetical protein
MAKAKKTAAKAPAKKTAPKATAKPAKKSPAAKVVELPAKKGAKKPAKASDEKSTKRPAYEAPAPSAKPAKPTKPAPAAKPAPATKPAKPAPAAKSAKSLRGKNAAMQIDLGYFDMKQNGYIVGELVVSPYVNGGIVPGTTMEYYYLYQVSSGVYAPFTQPSQSNTPCSIEFVWKAKGPGPGFDPLAYQYQQPVTNELISCTCVNCGTVQP